MSRCRRSIPRGADSPRFPVEIGAGGRGATFTKRVPAAAEASLHRNDLVLAHAALGADLDHLALGATEERAADRGRGRDHLDDHAVEGDAEAAALGSEEIVRAFAIDVDL